MGLASMSDMQQAVPLEQVPLHLQRHYTVRDLHELWGWSVDTLQRWFRDEPGVLKQSIGYRRGKDHKVTLRIPESVAKRVHERHCATV